MEASVEQVAGRAQSAARPVDRGADRAPRGAAQELISDTSGPAPRPAPDDVSAGGQCDSGRPLELGQVRFESRPGPAPPAAPGGTWRRRPSRRPEAELSPGSGRVSDWSRGPASARIKINHRPLASAAKPATPRQWPRAAFCPLLGGPPRGPSQSNLAADRSGGGPKKSGRRRLAGWLAGWICK